VFIGLIQNGMDLAQIQSYLREVVIGVLLILAVIADQLRQFIMCDSTSERTSIRPCASSKDASRGRENDRKHVNAAEMPSEPSAAAEREQSAKH
jgi:hypothetical protein